MKLVREYINEKFTEDSDPVHDLGIGAKAVIRYSYKKFIELTKKYANETYYYDVDNNFSLVGSKIDSIIQGLSIEENQLIVQVYSNKYYTKNKKYINKSKYITKLFKESGLWNFIEKFKETHKEGNKTLFDDYAIYYLIKPEYIEYYKEAIESGE